MDQERIGRFIQELRKEKNLTQKDLADKIGISDKAISKWENGRGMPDTSLLEPLCNELSVSVNELLAAEKLPPEEYALKAEENIMELLKDKKDSKATKIVQIILLIAGVGLAGLSIVMLFGAYGLLEPREIYDTYYSFPVICVVVISLPRSFRAILRTIKRTVLPIGFISMLIGFTSYIRFGEAWYEFMDDTATLTVGKFAELISYRDICAMELPLGPLYAFVIYLIATVLLSILDNRDEKRSANTEHRG